MDKLINAYKVLSDETRLRIMVLLAQGDLCVCQLSGVLGIPQPKVSKHLAKLRDMGFVCDERFEQFISYRLNSDSQIINCIIKFTLDNIGECPQLLLDQTRLNEKEKFLNQCREKLNSSKCSAVD